MGLGPPVCMKCIKIMNLDEGKWYCVICNSEPGDPDTTDLFGLSDEEKERIQNQIILDNI